MRGVTQHSAVECMRGPVLIALGVVFVVAAGGFPIALAAQEAAPSDSIHLETFDTAWGLINQRYWDPDFGGLDWNAVRDELRPRAARARDTEELREVLREMISRLGQSHFGVIPGPSSPPSSDQDTGNRAESKDRKAEAETHDGDSSEQACDADLQEQLVAVLDAQRRYEEASPGFEIALIDQDLIVSRVEPGSSAARASVEPGWRLLRVDGQSVRDVGRCLGQDLDQRAKKQLVYELARHFLLGDPGAATAVVLATPSGETVELELVREVPEDAQTVKFGNLPPVQFRFAREWIETPGHPRVGLIRFNIWMMPVAQAFEEAVIEMQDADGIILDLRGNPGGVAGLSAGLAGYFVDEAESLGTLKYRDSELHLRINPRRVSREGKVLSIYQGPLAILINQFSASTSEIFTAGLQDLGRARVFGETSAAAALPAVIERLPNGDLLMHALADLTRPSGERVEGIGVVPDEAIQLTRPALQAGVDEVLESALDWISRQAAKSSPGTRSEAPAL